MMDKGTKSKNVSKHIMQLIFVLIGILAIYTAYLGFAYGAVNWYYGFPVGQEYSKGFLMLDSNLRFYSGLWLGVGIIMLWMIPRIDKDKDMLRVIAILFFSWWNRALNIHINMWPAFVYVHGFRAT